MTREKIIETVNACVQYNANQGTWSIDNRFADELLALINKELSERLEQLHTEMDERMREEVAIEKRMGEKKAENAKKEVARDILSKMQYSLENPKTPRDFAIYTLGLIAKEYGVKL